MLARSLMYLELPAEGGGRSTYAVDLKQAGDSNGVVRAYLYLDSTQTAASKVPAVFPVPGGTIEVAASAFGLKRCHYVTPDGTEQQLTPDPRSAEGRRANFDTSHPGASRAIGALSLVVLVVGLLILIPQLIQQITVIPPIADTIGSFRSPIQLVAWQNIAVTLVTGAASIERALRLRFNWLLDGGVG